MISLTLVFIYQVSIKDQNNSGSTNGDSENVSYTFMIQTYKLRFGTYSSYLKGAGGGSKSFLVLENILDDCFDSDPDVCNVLY